MCEFDLALGEVQEARYLRIEDGELYPCPGTTVTDMSRDVLADPIMKKALIDPIPLGRLGTPEDLVGIVLYLSSDEANWTTGQMFIVDGGHTTK